MDKRKMRQRKLATIGLTILVVTATVFYFTPGEIPASMLIKNVNKWQVKETRNTEVKLKRGGIPWQHNGASGQNHSSQTLTETSMEKYPPFSRGMDTETIGSLPTSQIKGGLKPTPGKPKLLLIVAYLRSGSTFTSSLFTQQPDSFYVFEPLHMVVETVKKHMALRYVNGTVRRFPKGITDDPQSLFRECMAPWLRCAFHEVDIASLLDKFHLYYSKSMEPFLLCVKHIKFLNPLTRYSINHCIGETEMKCNSANLRVIKTIRLSMEMASH
ncbi:hypothetical protein MAR_007802 [Mya arenaria]|uniref:Sulfotransferase n=1 Tax=Mya arenaria TaxID=6604 RepID=A0ABY7DWG5_MYAAR|nr:uncharacterized protein LOC128230222 [Mya arenaria]WAR01244.1 hypothetical protein MAR_007802 [Mya arenaria]